MLETQERYSEWLRQCPSADRFSFELTGRHPYEWKVSSMRSELFEYVILSGPKTNGSDDQIRQELCRQLRNMVGKLG